jgi:actin-related protein
VPPIRDISVTLKGKEYEISNVNTVNEVKKKVQDASGIDVNQQGNVMFDGKVLESDHVLSDVGVQEGGKLTIVSDSILPTKEEMEEYLKEAGISKDKIEEMKQSFQDMMGGGGDGMPNLQESIKQMTDVMSSPLFQEMMSDPEKLEQSRQMIVNNPMLKGMMGSMPGMDTLLNDPIAWKQAMQAAAELYKNMDTKELMNAMMAGASGKSLTDLDMFGNTMQTLGDKTDSSSSAAAALNELSEDD